MLKEIEDAVLLHQARDKIESGLAILDNIFALGVATLGEVLKILEAVILEDFLNDFGDGFLLENLAIGGAGKEPEPGNNLSVVVAETVVATNTGKAAYKAIPMTLVIHGMVNGDGHLLADNVLERNRMVFGEKLGGEMKWLGDPLVAAKILKQEDVLAERRINCNQSFFLCIGHDKSSPCLSEYWRNFCSYYFLRLRARTTSSSNDIR